MELIHFQNMDIKIWKMDDLSIEKNNQKLMSMSIEIPEDLLEAFGSETLWRPIKKSS